MDTHHREGATHLSQGHIHPNQAPTLRQGVAILRHRVPILQEEEATPHRAVDTLLRLDTRQQQEDFPKLEGTLLQLEAFLRLVATLHNRVREVIPPCLQQVRPPEKFTFCLKGEFCYMLTAISAVYFAGGGWGAAPGGYGAVIESLFLHL